MDKNNNVVKKNAQFNLIEVVLLVLISSTFFGVFCGLLVYNNYDKITSNQVTLTEDGKFDEFIESYNNIMNSYVQDVDEDKLIEAAIEGMYNYLDDDYSIYMDEETTETLNEQLHGEYSGIGVEITMNDNNEVVIKRVFSDSPALEAGLKEGDILIGLDGVDLTGKDTAYFADTVKGSNKKSFDVTYKRDGKTYTVTIERKLVLIDSVSSKEYGNVGYIQITTFSGTTKKQVENKISEFSKNIDSVVIDLRNNTGGYLSAAYDTSDLFIEKGKTIYQLKDKNGKITKYDAKDGVKREFKKIGVIINGASASASEILALALKESANATIMGSKSYGKGTVQETSTLSSGAMVKYTTAYWLSPNGNSINEKGIEPDVKLTDNSQIINNAIEAIK